ncbi:MAG: FIST C-terminal domain-containing protein [Alphaproteobacteria bacterium]|nr:MAG: FIST C-terminal domain-containing protein [Alphaproteobacteria bacterium]
MTLGNTNPPPHARPLPFAYATGEDWSSIGKECLLKLGEIGNCNLGLVYVSDHLADDLSSLVTLLRRITGVSHWVGTVGVGLCALDKEIFDQPAAAIMLLDVPAENIHMFSIQRPSDVTELAQQAQKWFKDDLPPFAIVHADPRQDDLLSLLDSISLETGCFMVGGIVACRGTAIQLADSFTAGGISGVLLRGGSLPVSVGLTQACIPRGSFYVITGTEDNLITELDGRLALDVLREDMSQRGESETTATSIEDGLYVALSVPGSDTGDYIVRPVVGINRTAGWLALMEPVERGRRLSFTKRDATAAREDLRQMVQSLKRRLCAPARGALYISCLGRGTHLFGPGSQELKLIQYELGGIPLVGMFAGGEIFHGRLHGQSGVLCVFS